MSDEEISNQLDEIGRWLHGRGMSAEAIEEYLKNEAARVAEELENEINDYSR